MSWKSILKIQVRGFQDARRLGNEYAPKDIYESKIIDSVKYDLLSDNEKMKYHNALKRFLQKYGEDEWAKKRESFHQSMYARLRHDWKTGKDTYNRLSNMPSSKKYSAKPGKRPIHQNMPRKERSQLITDYFTLYQKRFNREPTLQEIKDEEGRPLTSFEEESYYRMKNR